jgi:Rrf2 family protein
MGKVLQSLVKAGIVGSSRGAAGGFWLTCDAGKISVLDVVQALDGPVGLNQCLVAGSACSRAKWCAGHTVWQEAQDAMLKVLRGASLRRLVEETNRNRKPKATVVELRWS